MLVKQCQRCYSQNRRAEAPLQVCVTVCTMNPLPGLCHSVYHKSTPGLCTYTCTMNPLQVCVCNEHVGHSNLALFQCHLLVSRHIYNSLHNIIVCLLLLCCVLSCIYTCISDCVRTCIVSFLAPNPRPERV